MVETRHSTYEINPNEKMIRRVTGKYENTSSHMRQCDGLWVEYDTVDIVAGRPMYIRWPDAHETITSKVTKVTSGAENLAS